MRRGLLAVAASASVVMGLGALGFSWLVLDERNGLDCFGEEMSSITVDGTGRGGEPTPEAAVLNTEWWKAMKLPERARVLSDEPDPEVGITVADDDLADTHARDGGRDFVVHIDGRAQVRFSIDRGLDGTYSISGATSCFEPSDSGSIR